MCRIYTTLHYCRLCNFGKGRYHIKYGGPEYCNTWHRLCQTLDYEGMYTHVPEKFETLDWQGIPQIDFELCGWHEYMTNLWGGVKESFTGGEEARAERTRRLARSVGFG